MQSAVIPAEPKVERYREAQRLVDEWRPVLFAVGLPVARRRQSSTTSPPLCRKFARSLEGRFGIPVLLVDERLSSASASAALERGRRSAAGRRRHTSTPLLRRRSSRRSSRKSMRLPDAEALLAALTEQMRAGITPETALVGIHTGGVWLAERLHASAESRCRRWARWMCPSTATITSASGSTASVKPSDIPFDVNGRHLVLVDDVLYTGRTIRAAHERTVRLRSSRKRAPRGTRRSRRARASDLRPVRRGDGDVGRDEHVELMRDESDWLVARRQPAAAQDAGELRRNARNPQLNANGELHHLLTDRRPAGGDPARRFSTPPCPLSRCTEREVKKIPLLRGKAIFNLFFESSTRTRTTFEIAAKRLSADVVNLNIGTSSQSKGETAARHGGESLGDAGGHVRRAPRRERRRASDRAPRGARDPRHQRRRRPPRAPDPGPARHVHHPPLQEGFHAALRVAIVGDILHSRVARSQIHALNILGVPEVRVIAPKTLLPSTSASSASTSTTTWQRASRTWTW